MPTDDSAFCVGKGHVQVGAVWTDRSDEAEYLMVLREFSN
jgi:uncharacterized protein (DUF736 family)